EDDVLAADPGLQPAGRNDAARFGEREIDIASRPAEAERCRSDPDAGGAVRAVRAAVGIGAGDELAGRHQPLLGKIEVKDAVSGRGVVRLLDAVQPRELAPDRRLLVIVFFAGKDEMVVGYRRLARVDGLAPGDLIEGMDRERRRAVR